MKKSPGIWTNHRNDLRYFKNYENPWIRESLACLYCGWEGRSNPKTCFNFLLILHQIFRFGNGLPLVIFDKLILRRNWLVLHSPFVRLPEVGSLPKPGPYPGCQTAGAEICHWLVNPTVTYHLYQYVFKFVHQQIKYKTWHEIIVCNC